MGRTGGDRPPVSPLAAARLDPAQSHGSRVEAVRIPAVGAPRGARWANRIAIAAMVAGAAVRVEEFGSRRSLWVDEALVANNVVTRDFAGLLRPLSGEQGAPIGWLWAQRVAVIAFGNNEYSLRLVPLFAGLIALVIVHRIAIRLLSPLGAAAVIWMLALSPAAVRYSVEVKQYSSDLAIGSLITLLALRTLRPTGPDGRPPTRQGDPRPRDRDLMIWGLVGAVGIWCAHPAVLVLAATGSVLTFDRVRRRDLGGSVRVVAASVPWVLAFGVAWLVSLRRLGHDSFLRSYWAAGLAPEPLRAATFGPWLGRALLHLIADPANLALVPLAAGLVLGGWAVLILRRPLAGAVVAFPLAAGAAAATVAGFPLRGRLALWLLPLAFMGLASLATALLPVRPAQRRGVGAAACLIALLVALVVVRPAAEVVSLTRDPTVWSDIRPLLQAVARRRQPGDLVWVHEPDAPAAAYYAVSVGVAPTHVLLSSAPPAACPGDRDLSRVAAGHRVWFVYGYRLSTALPGERSAIVDALDARARLVEQINRPDATAWLFDFGRPPDRALPASTRPTLPCLALDPLLAPRPTGLSRGPFGWGGPT